jgi:hypothetical protein
MENDISERPQGSVFLVQHVHVHPTGEETVKVIGVYRSRIAAEQAVVRVAAQPGFRDHPRIIDPLTDNEESGFYIDEYQIGKDHWAEGYVPVE